MSRQCSYQSAYVVKFRSRLWPCHNEIDEKNVLAKHRETNLTKGYHSTISKITMQSTKKKNHFIKDYHFCRFCRLDFIMIYCWTLWVVFCFPVLLLCAIVLGYWLSLFLLNTVLFWIKCNVSTCVYFSTHYLEWHQV